MSTRCPTLLWFAVWFILMVHGAGDHLVDTVDSAAVQPDTQRSHHQSLYGYLLNSRQCLLHIHHQEVLGIYSRTNIMFKPYFKYICNICFTKLWINQ